MKILDVTTAVLLIAGGLNWGLVGAFGFDLVAALLGEMTAGARLVYVLVGLSALYQTGQWALSRDRSRVPARARA